MAYGISSFLEEREVPIITNLEPFYPKSKDQAAAQKKVMVVYMSLDRTAQDVTKELKKKMRVLDRGSFHN